MSGVARLGTSFYFWRVQFVANRMAPKWLRSDGHFDIYAHSTEVSPKRPFFFDFLEYGWENGPYLRVEWSKIDATNAVVHEKDCVTIAVLQFSMKFLRVVDGRCAQSQWSMCRKTGS